MVAWLAGSIVYSTQFHLRNYLSSQGREVVTAKDLEGPGQRKVMDRKAFLKRVLAYQVIKLAVAAFLTYQLLT